MDACLLRMIYRIKYRIKIVKLCKMLIFWTYLCAINFFKSILFESNGLKLNYFEEVKCQSS